MEQKVILVKQRAKLLLSFMLESHIAMIPYCVHKFLDALMNFLNVYKYSVFLEESVGDHRIS